VPFYFFQLFILAMQQTPTYMYFFGLFFLLLEIYASATEGISKAWISKYHSQKRLQPLRSGHFQDSEHLHHASKFLGRLIGISWSRKLLF